MEAAQKIVDKWLNEGIVENSNLLPLLISVSGVSGNFLFNFPVALEIALSSWFPRIVKMATDYMSLCVRIVSTITRLLDISLHFR